MHIAAFFSPADASWNQAGQRQQQEKRFDHCHAGGKDRRL
jgi:hypothetical protein